MHLPQEQRKLRDVQRANDANKVPVLMFDVKVIGPRTTSTMPQNKNFSKTCCETKAIFL